MKKVSTECENCPHAQACVLSDTYIELAFNGAELGARELLVEDTRMGTKVVFRDNAAPTEPKLRRWKNLGIVRETIDKPELRQVPNTNCNECGLIERGECDGQTCNRRLALKIEELRESTPGLKVSGKSKLDQVECQKAPGATFPLHTNTFIIDQVKRRAKVKA